MEEVVKWDPPERANGIITGYFVALRALPDKGWEMDQAKMMMTFEGQNSCDQNIMNNHGESQQKVIIAGNIKPVNEQFKQAKQNCPPSSSDIYQVCLCIYHDSNI